MTPRACRSRGRQRHAPVRRVRAVAVRPVPGRRVAARPRPPLRVRGRRRGAHHRRRRAGTCPGSRADVRGSCRGCRPSGVRERRRVRSRCGQIRVAHHRPLPRHPLRRIYRRRQPMVRAFIVIFYCFIFFPDKLSLRTAPKPPAAWGSVGPLNATSWAPACPQTPGPTGNPSLVSEDCLFLNIWAPASLGATPPASRLPVMIYFNGACVERLDECSTRDCSTRAVHACFSPPFLLDVALSSHRAFRSSQAASSTTTTPEGARPATSVVDERCLLLTRRPACIGSPFDEYDGQRLASNGAMVVTVKCVPRRQPGE